MEKSGVTQGGDSARWLTVHDDLLRGLAHDVSNRVATVSAIASLLNPARLPTERVLAGLRADADRLERLLEQLRQLPRRADGEPEPMLAGDAVRTALALFAHHPDFREVACTVVAADDVPPVRADPVALVHAMCVALTAAARVGAGRSGATHAGVCVALSAEGDVVRLDVAANGGTGEGVDDDLALDAAAVTWLLEGSRGQGEAHAYGCRVEVPTLQSSRRVG